MVRVPGCTTDLYECNHVFVEYSPLSQDREVIISTNTSSSLLPQPTSASNQVAVLFVNIRACGYPPTTVCQNWWGVYHCIILSHCIIDIIVLYYIESLLYTVIHAGGSGRILFTFLLANNVCQVKHFVCRKSQNSAISIIMCCAGTTPVELMGVL